MTSEEPQVQLGDIIGNYRMVGPIGQGAMGTVFEAAHLHIERRAAIKVLLPRYAVDPDISARFLDEARALSRVRHRHVVEILDFGTLPAGAAYLVMEFLSGETLGQRLRRQGIRPPEALIIAHQIALGLCAIHQKEIIHRDLKPGNIMLVPDPEGPGQAVAKLVDFGLAKQSESTRDSTISGIIMGTPAYMAPEQCGGAFGEAPKKVDGRTDVYALGLILYELLARHRPFIGDTRELLAAQLTQEPAPLVDKVSDLDPAACALVHRMLAKDPTARPTAVAVAAELTRIAGGADGSMPSLLIVADLPRKHPSRRRLLFGVAGGLLVVGATTLVLLRPPPAVTPPRPLPVMPAPDLAPAPKKITWTIRSKPAGAQVLQSVDGVPLGETPLHLQQAPQPGSIKLRLRKHGYFDLPITVLGDRDQELSPELLRVNNENIPLP